MAAVLFKVALLTLKTAAKPLAKQFEKLVMSHPVMRKQVIGVAQASGQDSIQGLCGSSQLQHPSDASLCVLCIPPPPVHLPLFPPEPH
jgi:hypothetical protein